MAIKAKDEFINAILAHVSDYKLVDEKTVSYDGVLEMTKGLGSCGYSLSRLADIFATKGAKAEEYTYENGLKYGIITMSYLDYRNQMRTIRQEILTSNYKKTPIVNVVTEVENKAISQFLVSNDRANNLFSDDEKTIEKETTTIYVEGKCGSSFISYKDRNRGKLLTETYRQKYPVSGCKASALLSVCGTNANDLDIIYKEDEPIYAELSSSRGVEMVGYRPTNKEDVEHMVNEIKKEVGEIVYAIHMCIQGYEIGHENKEQVKEYKNMRKRMQNIVRK